MTVDNSGVFNSKAILMDHFMGRVDETFSRIFGGGDPTCHRALRQSVCMATEILANTDALYHDASHTMMVTVVGQEILRGKYLRDGTVRPEDWVHFIISLLCHDIGYVRGICPGDTEQVAVIDDKGSTVEIPAGATDAFLTPYHVDRAKLFVRRRFRDHEYVDPAVIIRNIENTRFPVPAAEDSTDNSDYPGLVRAADLIGQLADPDYLRKLPALFYEFEETGANARIGYETPEDVREKYPEFFWKMVSHHIGPAVSYLKVTREGRQWVSGLYSHIFSQEHRDLL